MRWLIHTLILCLGSSILAADAPPTVARRESPGVALKRLYTERCAADVKALARQLDDMDRVTKAEIGRSTNGLQALDEAWTKGPQARGIYSALFKAVILYNSWTAGTTEIPASFQLPQSLVDEALSKKRWESIRLLLLPIAPTTNGLGWDRPDDDEKAWKTSPVGRQYEFLALLDWLESPPSDATEFQRNWVCREAGEEEVKQALTNAAPVRHYLQNDYEYAPLSPPKAAAWPSRARWAAEQLVWPRERQATAEEFAKSVKAKDEILLQIAQLYYRNAKSSVTRSWLACGARWSPFFTLFDPKPDPEGTRALLQRDARGSKVVHQMMGDDTDISRAVFCAQLVAGPNIECYVPDGPWTGLTPVTCTKVPGDTNLAAKAASEAPKLEEKAPSDSLPPERVWREISRWTAEHLRALNLPHGAKVNVSVLPPPDWRLAFGSAELADELNRVGLALAADPSATSTSVRVLVTHPPTRPGEMGEMAFELFTGSGPTLARTISVPGLWPAWFAAPMGVSRAEFWLLLGALGVVTAVAMAWCFLRWRPRNSTRLEPLVWWLGALCLFLPMAGLAELLIQATRLPVAETFAVSPSMFTLGVSAVAVLSSGAFLALQWRLWSAAGGAYQGWQRTLPLWCGLALVGFLAHYAFVWHLGPRPQASSSPVGGTVQIIAAADGSLSKPTRVFCERCAKAFFNQLIGNANQGRPNAADQNPSVRFFTTVRGLLAGFFKFQWLRSHQEIASNGRRIGPATDLRYRLVAASSFDEAPDHPEVVAEGRVRPDDEKQFTRDWSRLFMAPTNRYGHPSIPSAMAAGPPRNATFTLVFHHGDHGGLRPRILARAADGAASADANAASSMAVFLDTDTRDVNTERALTASDRWDWLSAHATHTWSLASGVGHSLQHTLSAKTPAELDAGGQSPEALEKSRANSAQQTSGAQMDAAIDEVATKGMEQFQNQATQNSLSRLASPSTWAHWVFLWLLLAFFLPVAWSQFLLGARRKKVAIWRFGLVVLAATLCLGGYAWLWQFQPQTTSYYPSDWAGFSACCYGLLAGLFLACALALILCSTRKDAYATAVRPHPFGSDLLRWTMPLAGSLAMAAAALIWWINPVADEPSGTLSRILPNLPSGSLLALSFWVAGTSCLLLPRSYRKLKT
jgi:hypothetical protein